MKAQFKKADASGARYALIFGADELARGEVGSEGSAQPRDAASRARPRAVDALAARSGARRLALHNPGFSRETRHGHPSRPRRAGTARSAEGVLEAVRQPHHLAADPGRSAATPPGTAGICTSATRAAKAGSLYDELDARRPGGDTDRATRIFADMKERYPRATFTQQAGLVAARVAAEKGQYDAAEAAWPGSPTTRATASTARSPVCAWPACCSTPKKYDEALKQLDAIEARVHGPRRRPSRRHPAGAGQERRGASRLPEGVDGDGSEGRLPAPRRGQAEPARRPAGGERCERRRGRPSDARRAPVTARGARRARSSRRSRPRWSRGCSTSARCSAPRRPKPKDARADRRADHRAAGLDARASARSSSRSPSPSTAMC